MSNTITGRAPAQPPQQAQPPYPVADQDAPPPGQAPLNPPVPNRTKKKKAKPATGTAPNTSEKPAQRVLKKLGK